MIWDWPLRLWHWTFAAALVVSLYTGLADDITLMDAHLISGQLVVVLLLFRLGWAAWGGRHARLTTYLSAPRRLIAQVRGMPADPSAAHTPLGAMMAVVIWLAAAVQAGTGLFSSDDIFTEGPFARHLSDAGVDTATFIHHRAFWIIIALAAGHVATIAWYGIWRRDALALGMFTGHKAGPAPDHAHRLVAGILTLAAALALGYLALEIY